MNQIDKNLLKAKIVERGLNYGLLAQEMGVNPGTISNILNGRTAPSFPVIIGISESLGLGPEDFYKIFMPALTERLVGAVS
ncbi:helix-turn-helix transcriptional regulator [Aerococcaceae bacterium DSM 111176]|nr:helix-turn-helix transcriptional regulator [Aerococcaceae bacterium DSM 111176]